MKNLIIAIVVVFVTWSLMDFVIHGMLLDSAYKATASLWRPEAEMKMGLMTLVTFLYSAGFVCIFDKLADIKSLQKAIQYGAIFGVTTGISMGFGTYAFMAMPYSLALSWFFAAVVEGLVAGFIIGYLLKSDQELEQAI